MSAQELLKQVEAVWTEEMEERSGNWVAALLEETRDGQSSLKRLELATELFREWAPLYLYTSLSRASKSAIDFALRFEGQDVGVIKIEGEEVWLCVNPKAAQTNERDFGCDLWGRWTGRSREAAQFRRHFRDLALEGKRTEHSIESEFLRQMRMADSSQFEETLRHIQPVLLAGCPFQVPVPLSASSGAPTATLKNGKPTKGNIDIVARRGVNRLSVWELKKPGAQNKDTLKQAFIYSVALLKMLRSPSGANWYRLFGYSGALPNKLVIESIAAVCPNNDAQKGAFHERFERFVAPTPLTVESGEYRDEIKPLIAYYKLNPLRFDPPLTE